MFKYIYRFKVCLTWAQRFNTFKYIILRFHTWSVCYLSYSHLNISMYYACFIDWICVNHVYFLFVSVLSCLYKFNMWWNNCLFFPKHSSENHVWLYELSVISSESNCIYGDLIVCLNSLQQISIMFDSTVMHVPISLQDSVVCTHIYTHQYVYLSKSWY